VTIKWFCCLGTGDDPSQLPVETKTVSDFNASHANIKLVFDHVAYTGARDALATEAVAALILVALVGGTVAWRARERSR